MLSMFSHDLFSGSIFESSLQTMQKSKQRHPLTPSNSAIPTQPMFDTFHSSLPTQMTRAEALAHALPFEDEEPGDNSGIRQPVNHLQTNTDGSRKRRKFNEFREMDYIPVSRSLTPEIKTEGHVPQQPHTSSFPEDSAEFDVKPKSQQFKKRRPNQRTNVRAKMLWTDDETADLIKGVNLVGYGRWKKVLNHPDLKFLDERTSVDLKDRYRTCLNNGWATNTTRKPLPPRKRRRKSDASIEFFPPYSSNTPPKPDSHYNVVDLDDPAKRRSTTPLSHPPSPRVQFPVRTRSTNKQKSTMKVSHRKQKQAWTRKEDGLLWAGYKKHGFKWRAIAKDDSIGLTHRRCTAIRDRFRLMLPSLYMDNVNIKSEAGGDGKRKIHWSLRKLVGRELDGPDPVLLALSEEGPGEEEGEATFTDQEDEDGDGDGDEDDGNEEEEDEARGETNAAACVNGLLCNGDGTQQFEDINYNLDSLNLDFSASEPLLQRFFNDEDFELGYDEEADEDYFDDGMMENNGFPGFPFLPEFGENPPDFSELWNDNDEDRREEDSEEGSEDAELGLKNGFEDYLEDSDGRGSNEPENGYDYDRAHDNSRGGPMTAAPLLWEEMATRPILDLEVDE